MPCIRYEDKNFRADALLIIDQANAICEQYAAQGYDLTLRQLYYQFVARGWLENDQSQYARLGKIVNDARMAGLIDWDYITDRTRNLRGLKHWNSPTQAVEELSKNFRFEKWKDQKNRIEVWIEKDALVGVLQAACEPMDVDYFSCRGYTSVSEVWGAAQRIRSYMEQGQKVTILHLGDHDPSGVDMTRDIKERLWLFLATDFFNGRSETLAKMNKADAIAFTDANFEVKRIALTMDQVRALNPPPNPAKPKDARYRKYVERYGRECWELDALSPDVLVNLIQNSILRLRDEEKWEKQITREKAAKKVLKRVGARWHDVVKFFDFLDKKGK